MSDYGGSLAVSTSSGASNSGATQGGGGGGTKYNIGGGISQKELLTLGGILVLIMFVFFYAFRK